MQRIRRAFRLSEAIVAFKNLVLASFLHLMQLLVLCLPFLAVCWLRNKRLDVHLADAESSETHCGLCVRARVCL